MEPMSKLALLGFVLSVVGVFVAIALLRKRP